MMDSDNQLTRGLISWAIKGVLYKAYVALVLMISAGTWDWIGGWIYVGIFLGFDVATAIAVIPRSPELLLERTRRNPDMKAWDKVIMPLAAGLLPLIGWILAGLGQRYAWPPVVRPSLAAAGFVLTLLGHALIVWAMAANAFFSAVVRIQTDREHTVATGGPYRWIRHPGYLGAIAFSIGIPFLLTSWWALIPGVFSVILYILRTHLEDQTLIEELAGYQEFTGKTKFRLIPGIW